MELVELYDHMSELLDRASIICNDDTISDPYEAIEGLTNLMGEIGSYDNQLNDLIDDITQTMEDIDSMEAEEYFRGDIDESKKSKKKIIRLSESDLTKIVKRVIKEGMESSVQHPTPEEIIKGKKTGCYKVNKGDQLLKIAKSFGITLDSIKSLNGLKNDSIGVGNVIRVKETTKFEGC